MYKAMQAIESLPATISAKLDSFESRIAAMETGGVGAVDDRPQSGFEIAMALLANPQISQMVGQVLPGLLSSIVPGLKLPVPVASNMQVSGVDELMAKPFSISQVDAQKLENALARLGPHCDLVNDITALADLAETKPELFKMLLGNLKNL
jgi:hypothetical protein